MSVAGTKAAIPEMLERALKDETAPRTPSQHHYRHINTNSAIFTTLARDSKENKDYLSTL